MATIPTGGMERELRALYLRWLRSLPPVGEDLTLQIAQFQEQANAIIEKYGGRIAARGAYLDFPAPQLLELSPHVGTIYVAMEQAAIQASIAIGINSREAAALMLRAGMDKSFRRLERLARTETVRAYWKNAFDSVADLPELVMIWSSEESKRTCEWCKERDGLVMSDPFVRDHPNGRCTPVPTRRDQVEYRGSVDGNGKIFWEKNWRKIRDTPPGMMPAVLGQKFQDTVD